jgi:hypothetical protein
MGDTNPAPILAHGGFLAAARSLKDQITEPIHSFLSKTTGLLKILFTGHSAGGAVASLLYAHFYTNNLCRCLTLPYFASDTILVQVNLPSIYSSIRPSTNNRKPHSTNTPPPLSH